MEICSLFKKCSKRDTFKITSEFRLCRLYKGSDDGAYIRSECKVCEKKASDQLKEAKKQAPPKPETCHCCGKKTKNLVVDHCHNTGDYRGWLCRNCNQGIGKLGDTIEGLEQALTYLREKKCYAKYPTEMPTRQRTSTTTT
jgi:hypothetical protein